MRNPVRPFPVFLCAVALSSSLHAQWNSIQNATATTLTKSSATLSSGAATVSVTVLADDLVRVRLQPAPSDRPDRSWAVVKTDWPAVSVDAAENADSVTLNTAKLHVTILKHPIRLIFRDPAGNVINQDDPALGMMVNGREVRVSKSMPVDELYYGFGEKTNQFVKRDRSLTMWNSDIPAYTQDDDPLYQSVPFFYGLRKGRAYGIFLDNTWHSSFDMGKESRTRYSFGAEGGDLDYYFFAGPTPHGILSRFAELTGKMPLPPLWSLGFQQCRWSYPTEKRVREVAGTFRSLSIPCDVIYLDIDYMLGFRVFTWHPDRFPDPKKMIADLGRQGFHVAVILDPGIKTDSAYATYRSGLAGDQFVRYPDGRLFTGGVWPGICAFPDFSNEPARRWWGDELVKVAGPGVRGYWTDMNEPSVFEVPTKTVDESVIHKNDGIPTTHDEVHNEYGMLMTKATYDGALRAVPGERPFILTRASYAGGWRYAAAWTGDNVANWTHLQMALTMTLGMSMSGQPFCGSDIGGFFGNPSGELFARWLQLGVFTPLMRAHSIIEAKDKEPWTYGEKWTGINRSTINLRYAFLPTIYTEMERASRTGIPPMRAPIFEYPADTRYNEMDQEFLFGPNLLVAPVLEEGDTTKKVVIPLDGSWYDYVTGTRHAPGTSPVVDAAADRLPLFARNGSVIATRTAVQHTGEAPINPLVLTVFPPDSGRTGSGDLYEDDGLSFAFRTGAFSRRSFTTREEGKSLLLGISAVEGSYRFPDRNLTARFMALPRAPRSVSVDGRMVKGWTYDGAARVLSVTVPDTRSAQTIAVGF
jgi:alpha-glucosidase